MPERKTSLLAGRNAAPLSDQEVRRAINTFLGMDKNVTARYQQDANSVFRVSIDENGDQYGEIVFGPDIYPGSNLVDPNSALSLDAAISHELTHYHRWKDKMALSDDVLEHVDEALTSLQAIMRYYRQLNENDIRQLVADAIKRLQLFVQQQGEEKAGVEKNAADAEKN